MPILFEDLTADKLKTLDRDKTVFFFIIGPLEDFGPHLPMGLDLIKAKALATGLAKKLESEKMGWVGVLMPIFPAGVDTHTTSIYFNVRAYVIRDWLVDFCQTLVEMGFKKYVCISGNLGPKQLTAIEEAGKIINRSNSLIKRLFKKSTPLQFVSASSPLVSPAEVIKSPLWSMPKEHGGKLDTSLGLYLDPQKIDTNFNTLPSIPAPTAAIPHGFNRWMKKVRGYWGNPAQASAKTGEEHLKQQIETIFPKLLVLWEGAKPDSLFRSWYFIFPPNRSFFKAWLLFLGVTLLMVLWTYLSFKELIQSL